MVAIILILNLIVLTLFQINKVTSLSNPTEVEVEGSHVYVRFTPYLDYSERTEEGLRDRHHFKFDGKTSEFLSFVGFFFAFKKIFKTILERRRFSSEIFDT